MTISTPGADRRRRHPRRRGARLGRARAGRRGRALRAPPRAHRAALPPDRGAPRLGRRLRVVERPRAGPSTTPAASRPRSHGDHQHRRAEARGLHRPRRHRAGRRAQRGARDARRRARPLPGDGRRPARHGRPSSPRAPAPRSATCASGSTPRRRAASSCYDAEADAYVLPPEHALVLADDTSPFVDDRRVPGRERRRRGPRARSPSASSTARASAGTSTTTASGTAPSGRSRSSYRAYLVAEWLPALDGVVEKLEAGALVADVGCGHGASTILMAQAFPASRFVGIDYHADSIATARERAAEAGVADRVTFEVAGAADCAARATTSSRSSTRSTTSATRSPRRAARRRRSRPAAPACSSSRTPATGVEDNLNPVGRFYYGFSTLVCTPGLAVAARPRRARHPGRRGAAARGAAGRRVRRGPPRRRDAAEPRARGSAPALAGRRGGASPPGDAHREVATSSSVSPCAKPGADLHGGASEPLYRAAARPTGTTGARPPRTRSSPNSPKATP